MAELNTLPVMARAGVGKGAARAVRREGLVPGVIYGDGKDPVAVSVKHNLLLKALKRGKFLSSLLELDVDGEKIKVIPRDVQRDVVLDLPIHVDFLRLSERSRINLFVPVEFINQDKCPGIKKGGVLNVVRHDVELKVRAGNIPEALICDLEGWEVGDTIHISSMELPGGAKPVIQDRDFTVATIAAPSGLRSSESDEGVGEGETAEGEEVADEA
ncbi:MAG: 50S ribosomal protein L25/general stress protein Ctc [Neomegalonema sp.]